VKTAAAALSVVVLITLLTWLSLRAFDSGAERFDRALGELERFDSTESDLHGNILSARAGLLRNYDPLVRDTNALDALVQRIRASMAGDRTTEAAIDRLNASVRRQEALTEQFKSNNALLQNSLAYFAWFSAQMSAPGHDDPLAPEVSALAAAMLDLTLDTDPASIAEVRDRLGALERRVEPAPSISPAVALLAHGRMLYELLPATDRLLKTLNGLSRMHSQETVRSLLLMHQLASRATARRFREILYLTSLLLVGLLVYVGILLRARARALRRRAAFEHILSGISTRIVAARDGDLEPVVAQALAEMASCIGASRAYFVAVGALALTGAWHRSGSAFPPGWPDGAVALLRRHRFPTFEHVVHVPDIARLPAVAKDALAAAGLTGWACATSRTIDGSDMLLGFDTVGHPSRLRRGELGLLHMALHTIASALGRQILEQERIRLETRLEHARRLETVGTFASGIAHNFNNIVGAILGYVEYADEHSSSSHVLDEIRKAGERARELIEQILNIARRHDVVRRDVNVSTVIDEAVSLLRASLPANVELQAGSVPASVMVRGVAAHLQQVILNLCNNAAQAMDHAGRIELDIATVDLATPRTLSHGTLAAGAHVRIAVSDTGHGMDPSVLARIFEPFFTTRPNGNGFGLASSRDIVREHGGTMHVESAVDRGSRFEVWLPRLSAGLSGAEAPVPFGQGETVLLVECDTRQRLRDEEILAALGYEPVGYSVAADALGACKASPERFDLILLAHPTAVTEMLELSTGLHQLVPGAPILLATFLADAVHATELVRAGVADVVPWPIAADETVAALRDSLRRRSAPQRLTVGGCTWLRAL
jgi:signal transduction histidine kinase/ActR/RegA family two-component response regulator